MFLSVAFYTRASLRRSRLLQIGLLILFSLLGQALAGWSGLPLPGGVIGLGLVLALLASRLLRASNLQRGASLLLGRCCCSSCRR